MPGEAIHESTILVKLFWTMEFLDRHVALRAPRDD